MELSKVKLGNRFIFSPSFLLCTSEDLPSRSWLVPKDGAMPHGAAAAQGTQAILQNGALPSSLIYQHVSEATQT